VVHYTVTVIVDRRCKSYTDWSRGESTESLSVFCCREIKSRATCYWLDFWGIYCL